MAPALECEPRPSPLNVANCRRPGSSPSRQNTDDAALTPRVLQEASFEVRQDVVDRLDAYGETHKVRAYAGRRLLRLAQLRVGRRCRVDGEAPGVADVGEVAEEFQALDEVPPGVAAASIPKDTMAPAPLGRYRSWRSCQGLDASPAYLTQWTSLRASSQFATAVALATWRSIRRLRVSSPWRKRNEFKGAIAGPRSRRYCKRAFSTKRAGKSDSGSWPKTSRGSWGPAR